MIRLAIHRVPSFFSQIARHTIRLRYKRARLLSSSHSEDDIFTIQERRRLARIRVERQLQWLEDEIHTLDFDEPAKGRHSEAGLRSLTAEDREEILSFYNQESKESPATKTSDEPLLDLSSSTDEGPPLFGRRLCDEFQGLMRSVPKALAVVTAVSNENSKPRGLLVSSFDSVTVFPIPYISINVKTTSSTLAAIRDSRRFIVTLIDSTHTAAVFADLESNGEELRQQMLQPDGKLKPGNGTVIWLKCRWSSPNQVVVGDHVVLVAEVLDVGKAPGKDLEESTTVYWHGDCTTVPGRKSDVRPNLAQSHSRNFRKVAEPYTPFPERVSGVSVVRRVLVSFASDEDELPDA